MRPAIYEWSISFLSTVAAYGSLLPRRILLRTKKVKRHIRLIPHDPAIMARRYIEHISRPHLNYPPIIHRRRRAPGHHHPHMLHHATLRPSSRSHMQRPLPSWLVRSPSNRHPSHGHQLKLPLLKHPHLIRLLKSLQNHIQHWLLASIKEIFLALRRSIYVTDG